MREFEKEWVRQVEDKLKDPNYPRRIEPFVALYNAFRKDKPIREMKRHREADQKRWWWDK